ncbi:hypothetical protein [Stackebrandtia soli]|uniref:hypothetical protein n=1 Tax=Stackebrandtia soli TaxID=1892856 RepID=UPI0039EA129D
MTSKKLTLVSLIGAPLLLLVGWAVMRLGSGGVEPGWTVAHVAWVIDNLMFGVVAVAMARAVRPSTGLGKALGWGFAGLALAGAAAMTAQMIIDLIGGAVTTTTAELGEFFTTVQSAPGVELLVYQVGPALLFVALAAQSIQLATVRRVPVMAAVLVGAAVSIAGAEQLVDLPLRLGQAIAALTLLAGFTIIARTLWNRTEESVGRSDRPLVSVSR